MIKWKANEKLRVINPWISPSEMTPLVVCIHETPSGLPNFWHSGISGRSGWWAAAGWPFYPLVDQLVEEIKGNE